MLMEMKLWYAVSGTGQGAVFLAPPIRDEKRMKWIGNMEGCVSWTVYLMESRGFELPNIKWADEPVELQLLIRKAE